VKFVPNTKAVDGNLTKPAFTAQTNSLRKIAKLKKAASGMLLIIFACFAVI
jgi:hypothetical protein